MAIYPTIRVKSPTGGVAQVSSDWNSATGVNQVLNKPNFAQVAISGNYSDLLGLPTLSTVANTGLYSDLLGRPPIPAAQVSSDWSAQVGVSQVLNKPIFSLVATSGSYADLSGKPAIPAAQVNSNWTATSGVAQILNKPSIPVLSFATPAAKTLAKATAYQATDATKPAMVTITLTSTSSFSLSGTVANAANILIGPTNAVATGTGTIIGKYNNALGGTLTIGLNMTNTATCSYTVALPAGWYYSVIQTTGSGVTIDSAFEQVVG